MESFTSQADDLRKQSEDIQLPISYPPYTSCYEVLLSQQDLILEAQKLEYSARMIRSRFNEIANSSLQVLACSLLRKAVVSVRHGAYGFSVDQLEEVVDLIMGKNAYILFKPKTKSKNYVVLLFWASNIDDQECDIQKQAEVVKKETSVDDYSLRFAVENISNPKSQIAYLTNNFSCAQIQNDDLVNLPSESHEQLQSFIEVIQTTSRKRKADSK